MFPAQTRRALRVMSSSIRMQLHSRWNLELGICASVFCHWLECCLFLAQMMNFALYGFRLKHFRPAFFVWSLQSLTRPCHHVFRIRFHLQITFSPIPPLIRKLIYAFAVFNAAISPYLYGYFSFDLKKELLLLSKCSNTELSDRQLSVSNFVSGRYAFGVIFLYEDT